MASSYLHQLRNDEDEDVDAVDKNRVVQAGADETARGTPLLPAKSIDKSHDFCTSSVLIPVRRNDFVANDDYRLGTAVFLATKAIHGPHGKKHMTAVAIPQNGKTKFSKVLRMMYAAPRSITSHLNKWIAVPKLGVIMAYSLFAGIKMHIWRLLSNSHC